MKITILGPSRLVVQAVVVSAALALAGCSSNSVERAEDTAESLQSSVTSIDKGKVLVNNALAALDKVQQSAGSDPRPAYKKFSDSVDDIEKAATKVNKTVSSMNSRGKKYYDSWRQELSGMKSEQLRAISTERQAQSLTAFNQVSSAYKVVAKDYKPFITDLRDVRTYLGNDLTPTGINAVKQLGQPDNEQGVRT